MTEQLTQTPTGRELTAGNVGDHIDIDIAVRPNLRDPQGRRIQAQGKIDRVSKVGDAVILTVDGAEVVIPARARINVTRSQGRSPMQVAAPKAQPTPVPRAEVKHAVYISPVLPSRTHHRIGSTVVVDVEDLSHDLIGHEITIPGTVGVLEHYESSRYDGMVDLTINGHRYTVSGATIAQIRITNRVDVYKAA